MCTRLRVWPVFDPYRTLLLTMYSCLSAILRTEWVHYQCLEDALTEALLVRRTGEMRAALFRYWPLQKWTRDLFYFRPIPERARSHADIRRRRLIACKQSFGWGPLESRWRGPISIGFPLGGSSEWRFFKSCQALERNDLAAGSVQVEGRFSGGSWGRVGLT